MKLFVGDKVKIIHSPYTSVKNGTVATIKAIHFEIYGKYWANYILDTSPCSTFKIHEIEKIQEVEE